jgi:putative transposase
MPFVLSAIGVDFGLKQFAVLSNGEAIANPRFFRTEEKRLVKAQRKLSAAKKGSPEQKKGRKIVARVHERIANKRRDFAHQESRKLVNRFAIIVFENLNIRGMLKNTRLAKSIADAAWNQLAQFTSYKAENAGRCVVQVNPRNTSQTCSKCGELVEKDLSVRVHHCSSCGLTLDRDHNAAINILALGLQSISQLRSVSEIARYVDATVLSRDNDQHSSVPICFRCKEVAELKQTQNRGKPLCQSYQTSMLR